MNKVNVFNAQMFLEIIVQLVILHNVTVALIAKLLNLLVFF